MPKKKGKNIHEFVKWKKAPRGTFISIKDLENVGSSHVKKGSRGIAKGKKITHCSQGGRRSGGRRGEGGLEREGFLRKGGSTTSDKVHSGLERGGRSVGGRGGEGYQLQDSVYDAQ